MRKSLDQLYRNQSVIYKGLLYILSLACIVFFFPRDGSPKLDVKLGSVWQQDDFYAPYDVQLKKSDTAIAEEQRDIKQGHLPYYKYDQQIVDTAFGQFEATFATFFDSANLSDVQWATLQETGKNLLGAVYEKGVFANGTLPQGQQEIMLVKQRDTPVIQVNALIEQKLVAKLVQQKARELGHGEHAANFGQLVSKLALANVFFDKSLTDNALHDKLAKLSPFGQRVDKGAVLIKKGELINSEKLALLQTFRQSLESGQMQPNINYYTLIGYTILVALVLMMLFLFLRKYRREVYDNNTKVTFIVFNMVLMVLVTTFMVDYNETYVFVVPLCILPLLLKTFFDARLGLFVHVLTVLILGFVVPNSFEYVFLQIIAGIVTILTISEIYKRADLFISVGQITLIYCIGYLAFHIVRQGGIHNMQWFALGLFLLNGMITLFVQPLIYIYEKVFGLVSDVSLLELSDSNSRLLKDLSNKAPGTFHHSLQVANLAEAAANEIGANAMLVRVGALYHDIGKMPDPTYFTENQITSANPHDELSPKDSAKVIVGHVIKGIELARKHNLPDRIIDFIRTHHGTTLVYYFYKKQQEIGQHFNEDDFRYPGPIPFSKETAILMMADSVEAASKSLKNPTFLVIDEFVEKIISGQMAGGQFINADITLKDIETVKKVFKQKLTNIYHLRVEYPE